MLKYDIDTKFLIYTSRKNLIKEWSGSDVEDLFNKNLLIQPEDWYYRHNNFNYHFNDLGYRCKDLTDLDLQNYNLFVGCSFTEGVGLPLEFTYPYILSKKLDMDYYNLAMGGTSTEVCFYNTINWLETVKVPPKMLFFQWTGIERTLRTFNPELKFSDILPRFASEEEEKLLVLGSTLGMFNAKRFLFKNLLHTICNRKTKIIEIAVSLKGWKNGEPFELKSLDRARDHLHLGVQSHQDLVDNLYRELYDKNNRERK